MLQLQTDPGRRYRYEMMYHGLGTEYPMRYPFWMHKDGADPVVVSDTDAEIKAMADGYDRITAAAMSNRHLTNWVWDLEDFSPKQLVVFAHDEYGVDLPIEAGQEKLYRAVTVLSKFAPQNVSRLVLMAHEISMEYDATLEEIRRMSEGKGQALETETTVTEVYA